MSRVFVVVISFFDILKDLKTFGNLQFSGQRKFIHKATGHKEIISLFYALQVTFTLDFSNTFGYYINSVAVRNIGTVNTAVYCYAV